MAAALSASLLVTTLGMVPIQAAAENTLPDPRPRPVMSGEVVAMQPSVDTARAVSNRVAKLTPERRANLESQGITIVESEVGSLVLEKLDDHGQRTRVAAFDAVTESGIEVIGLGFLDADAIEAIEAGETRDEIAFGPQSVFAHRNGTNHSHPAGWPFRACSYVYNWANGDSVFHMCSLDVVFYQYVAAAWVGALGAIASGGNPVVALLTGIFVFGGINNWRNPDGSIDLFVPNTSVVTHYGYSYYWGPREGWYYHYPQGHSRYGYALRVSTNFLYRTN